MKFVRRGIAAWLLVCAASTAAHAALIEIRMDGADFRYFQAATVICDSTSASACDGLTDPLTSLEIYVDGVLQQTLNSNIGINVNLVLPAGTDPALNGTHSVTVAGSVFDAFIGGTPPNLTPALLTDVVTGSVTFASAGQTVSGSGTSSFAGVPSLPLGLIPVNPIAWSFLVAGGCDGGVCNYAGNATLSWEGAAPVPEPSSMLLLGMGVAVAALARRRRRGLPHNE